MTERRVIKHRSGHKCTKILESSFHNGHNFTDQFGSDFTGSTPPPPSFSKGLGKGPLNTHESLPRVTGVGCLLPSSGSLPVLVGTPVCHLDSVSS